ncbi:hypothetical protein AB7C87_04180 [Natrarchaeobius sp. A-rgal3]|uniref:hypothetical protein n=1 Tax=Natrarchaeobius versutus TaxID=1679078 RepID=UPI00350F593E
MAIETFRNAPPVEKLSRAVRTVLSSVTLTTASAGAILIFVGFLLQEGVLAALLPIWGAGLMIVGLSAYLLIWWSRQ